MPFPSAQLAPQTGPVHTGDINMISLEDYEFLEFLGAVPLWAGLAAGILVAIVVFFLGRGLLRRLGNRIHARRWANSVGVIVWGYPGKAVIVNLSQGDVTLLMDHPATPGTTFTIHPAGAPESVPWIVVEVRRQCRSADGNWFVGCRFAEEVSWETMVWFGWQTGLPQSSDDPLGLAQQG